MPPPPSQYHHGERNASPIPPRPWRSDEQQQRGEERREREVRDEASKEPIRSPKRPITATWIEPATPATSASDDRYSRCSRHGRKLYAPAVLETKGAHMVRVDVLYEREPEPERYARHLEEFARKVECQAFRHGKAFGSPSASPPSRTTPSSSGPTWTRSRPPRAPTEFAASGKDAMEMGIPFTVTFVELS